MPNSIRRNDASTFSRHRAANKAPWTTKSLVCLIFWLWAGCTDTLVEPLVRTTPPPDDKTCPPPATACEGECHDFGSSNLHCGRCGLACGGGAHCESGSCVCEDGQTMCNGVCTSLDGDSHNCGACNRSCSPDDICIKGDCKSGCSSPAKYCDDVCVDVKSN
ncbi:MAG TPA: hypothetical protein PKA58_30395, partial [Polyangium sp.]|nr:hypothetical protein [Polyangium sp.]